MNLPPFYIGQKVISLADWENYAAAGFNVPKGLETYTVRGLRYLQGKNGMIWCVDLVEIRNEPRQMNGGFGEPSWTSVCFKAIEPLVTKLELTKVLEKVNEFVFTN